MHKYCIHPWLCCPGVDPEGHSSSLPGHRVAVAGQRHRHAGEESILGAAQDVVPLRKVDPQRHCPYLPRARILQRSGQFGPGGPLQCHEGKKHIRLGCLTLWKRHDCCLLQSILMPPYMPVFRKYVDDQIRLYAMSWWHVCTRVEQFIDFKWTLQCSRIQISNCQGAIWGKRGFILVCRLICFYTYICIVCTVDKFNALEMHIDTLLFHEAWKVEAIKPQLCFHSCCDLTYNAPT